MLDRSRSEDMLITAVRVTSHFDCKLALGNASSFETGGRSKDLGSWTGRHCRIVLQDEVERARILAVSGGLSFWKLNGADDDMTLPRRSPGNMAT